jgi:hypothetical protein
LSDSVTPYLKRIIRRITLIANLPYICEIKEEEIIMHAIEFETQAHNGIVQIPEHYLAWKNENA